jgi:hypothetical protein
VLQIECLQKESNTICCMFSCLAQFMWMSMTKNRLIHMLLFVVLEIDVARDCGHGMLFGSTLN